MTKLRCFKIRNVNLTIFQPLNETWFKKEEQKTVSKSCGMSKKDHDKLIKNYVRLIAELPTFDIVDYLKQNNILTEDMIERILNKETLRGRNSQLLSVLFRRGRKAFPCLIDDLLFLEL